MSTLNVVYQSVGCYQDAAQLLSVSFGLLSQMQAQFPSATSSIQACVSACDAHSVLLCAISGSPFGTLCVGSRDLPSADSWKTFTKASSPSVCNTACPVPNGCGGSQNSVDWSSLYLVGAGNTSMVIPDTSSRAVAPVEAQKKFNQTTFTDVGCYNVDYSSNSSSIDMIIGDTTPEDCLALCLDSNYYACGIAAGNRYCYSFSQAHFNGLAKLSSSSCNAPCRRSPHTSFIHGCGGIAVDQVMMDVYLQGNVSLSSAPPTPTAAISPTPTQPATAPGPSPSGASPAWPLILGVSLAAAAVIAGVSLVVYRRRRKSANTIGRVVSDTESTRGLTTQGSVESIQLPDIAYESQTLRREIVRSALDKEDVPADIHPPEREDWWQKIDVALRRTKSVTSRPGSPANFVASKGRQSTVSSTSGSRLFGFTNWSQAGSDVPDVPRLPTPLPGDRGNQPGRQGSPAPERPQ
ncbi:uncharacterized protein BJ171DRAFT_255735 [Polychytrium aggregatum]|uniref:uncharacterized protein n=1 Tax=Polychytrium aggregatum TaxID=110093 RepID=UPI0022FE5692|nr:uncharacterized protein BJ171DRAFT_255735 [Polychytrium aggregatum]KAI9207821.1 hypothetical protein BJ171DRAFT_255735 [Polychytrium aggregatum]